MTVTCEYIAMTIAIIYIAISQVVCAWMLVCKYGMCLLLIPRVDSLLWVPLKSNLYSIYGVYYDMCIISMNGSYIQKPFCNFPRAHAQ